MIYKLAYSISKNSVEDLYQVGVIGLIKAYDNYNSSYGTKFTTYAYSFILGEMTKYIRENKGIKISRELSYLKSRLEKLIVLLEQKYRRTPTTDELSLETGIEEWKIIEALNLKNCVRSLDDPTHIDGDVTFIDTISNSHDIEEEIILEDMLDSLDKEEQALIRERYFNDLTQSQIAEMTGYSQAKVSRREQKALCKLKKYYKTS